MRGKLSEVLHVTSFATELHYAERGQRGGRNSPVQTVGSTVDPYDKYKKKQNKRRVVKY